LPLPLALALTLALASDESSANRVSQPRTSEDEADDDEDDEADEDDDDEECVRSRQASAAASTRRQHASSSSSSRMWTACLDASVEDAVTFDATVDEDIDADDAEANVRNAPSASANSSSSIRHRAATAAASSYRPLAMAARMSASECQSAAGGWEACGATSSRSQARHEGPNGEAEADAEVEEAEGNMDGVVWAAAAGAAGADEDFFSADLRGRGGAETSEEE
jgi:hypothetical protein